MSKKRFELIDGDGDKAGFVVVNLPTTYEQIMPRQPFIAEGPLTDAAFMLAGLAGFTAGGAMFVWLAGGPGWIAPALGVGASFSLTAIRLIFHGPPDSPEESSLGDEVTIKVEAWTDEGLVVLEEIRDKSIQLDDLRKIARALLAGHANFSRPSLCRIAGISQGTYHKVKREFERLNFAHKAVGNNYVLSPRAMAFLRKVDGLPH